MTFDLTQACKYYQELQGSLWENCIDPDKRLKHHKKEKRNRREEGEAEGKKSQAKVKWKIAYIHVLRGLEHLLFWVTQGEQKWRRIEEEKNPFGKVDADRWEWRQAGQRASQEERVFVSVPVMCVCLLACTRRPRLLFLIDPAQHPSDPQDISEARKRLVEVERWWKGETARKRGRGERNIKINSAENITRNSTGRGTEIVNSY